MNPKILIPAALVATALVLAFLDTDAPAGSPTTLGAEAVGPKGYAKSSASDIAIAPPDVAVASVPSGKVSPDTGAVLPAHGFGLREVGTLGGYNGTRKQKRAPRLGESYVQL